MATTPTAEYITRKQAAELCQCSERTLQRYWSTSVDIGDEDTLRYLRLRMEDGEEIAGTEVTKQLIEDLKKQKRIPTWYVHAQWAEATYSPRVEARPIKPPSAAKEGSATVQFPAPDAEPAYVQLLREQLEHSQTAHEEDKKRFDEQLQMLKEMFDTLKDDHKDTKELLTKVHEVFGEVQKAQLASQSTTRRPHSSEAAVEPKQSTVVEVREKAKATPQQPARKTSSPKATRKGKKQSSEKKEGKKTKATTAKPKWYELPTLKKAFARKS